MSSVYFDMIRDADSSLIRDFHRTLYSEREIKLADNVVDAQSFEVKPRQWREVGQI